MFCRECGDEIANGLEICPKCGVPTGIVKSLDSEDALLRMAIPIGRSGYAIAAGYLGLFSLFPFLGFLASPLAIISGILAISDIRKSQGKKVGMGRAIFGIVCGSIGILGSIGIIVAILFK